MNQSELDALKGLCEKPTFMQNYIDKVRPALPRLIAEVEEATEIIRDMISIRDELEREAIKEPLGRSSVALMRLVKNEERARRFLDGEEGK